MMPAISKEAKAAYDREYRAKNKERIAAAKKLYASQNPERESARVKAWTEANKERSMAIKKAYRGRNPPTPRPKVLMSGEEKKRRSVERVRRWREENPEKYSKQLACFSGNPLTPGQKAHRAQAELKRYYVKRRAQPAWADTEAIAKVYAEAKTAGKHVDHIIPLRGELISGLHVANNLQPLTRSENSRKRNKFDLEAANAS